MRNMLAAMLVLAMSGAQAQVFKCTDASGKTVYSQAACPVQGEQMRPGQLSGNAVGTVQAPLSSPSGTTSAPAVIPGSPRCLNALGVKNVETTASSMLHDQHDKQVHAEQVRRAKACEPLMDESQMKAMKANLRTNAMQQREARQVRVPSLAASGDATGCWGTDGTRYNSAAGGNLVRQDGKFCRRSGTMIDCN